MWRGARGHRRCVSRAAWHPGPTATVWVTDGWVPPPVIPTIPCARAIKGASARRGGGSGEATESSFVQRDNRVVHLSRVGVGGEGEVRRRRS
uniref:Uncharacterized protein n=1 Tax=Oryza punctata TaxID=4537 RepID=A0A0E0JF49_ORYPU